MRPEWLPLPGDDAPDDLPALLLAYYADDLGELCAGIAGTLSQRHDDVRISRYDAETVRRNWYGSGRFFVRPVSRFDNHDSGRPNVRATSSIVSFFVSRAARMRAPSDKSISSLYPRTIADNYYCFSLFGDIRLRKAGYEKSKGREMASGKRTPEPTGSFSVLLFLRQIQIITDEANRKNVSRQDVIRDLIDRGIESRQEEERVAA